MAIYAQKTTFRSSAYIPDIKINGSTPNNQDILIWSDSEQAFVNGNISCILPPGSGGGGGGYGTIIDGENLGAGAEVFAGLDSSGMLLQFRSITGSDGITVEEDSINLGEINITNDIITDAEISVPDSFHLIIDNDDTTDTSAVFEILTNASAGSVSLVPVVYTDDSLNPVEIIADIALVLNGQIKVTGVDLIAAGFVVGMCVSLFGTTEQDGIWEIESLTTDTITITVPFPDATDAGFQPTGVAIEGLFFDILNVNNFQLTGTDLAAAGFVAGQTITIAGTTNGNDGVYTLSLIAFDVATIVESFPGTLGCDVSSIDINSASEIVPVGWCVNEIGEMKANDTTITGDIDVSGDIIIQGMTLEDYINMFTADFPENGLLTQTTDGIFVGREILGGPGVIVTNPDGIAGDPQIDVEDFTITLGDELEGDVTITGLGDAILNAALADLPQFAGLDGNDYNRVTIDGAGRVTLGVNQQTVGIQGIYVINGDGVAGNPMIGAQDFDLTFNGDVFGAGTVSGLNSVAIDLNLPDLIVPNSFNHVTVDTKGRVISGYTHPLDFQPQDDNLDTLALGFLDPGIVVWDGTDYIDRRVVGEVSEIVIDNGNGEFGDIKVQLAEDAILPGTGAITMPSGNLFQRPGAPTSGMIRHNNDDDTIESYIDGSWKAFITGPIEPHLEIAGGTMEGDINMEDNNITFTTGLVDGRDVSYDGEVLDAINTGTGIKVQLAPDTFTNREIAVETMQGVTVADADGVAGDPTLGFAGDNFPHSQAEPNYVNDKMIYHDATDGVTKTAPVGKINRRQAFTYFMSQI